MSVLWITADQIACPASPGRAGTEVLVRTTPDSCEILAVGSQADIAPHPEAARAERRDLRGHILIPGLVNAHTHLDLTAIGPRPRPSGQPFSKWLDSVRTSRTNGADDIAAAVEMGIRASLRGGVVAVGDIAGRFRTEPLDALRASPLMGVSYLELFGLGMFQKLACSQIDSIRESVDAGDGSPSQRVRMGLSPHAPYSAGPDVFSRSASMGVLVSTHLAESPEEHRIICDGDGPMRDFLRSVGVWSPTATKHFSGHRSPIAMAMPWLRMAPWVVAHVNDCSDDDLKDLASTRCSVAYCPRSSAYFENDKAFGPHRYREMMAAGINVCLGTDSVLNLPPGPESERISTLDEMRLLYRRDSSDPRVVLAMATTHGARALGLDPAEFTMRPGIVAGIVAVPVDSSTSRLDPAERILRSDGAPELLWPRVVRT